VRLIVALGGVAHSSGQQLLLCEFCALCVDRGDPAAARSGCQLARLNATNAF
jgi:hypothetical protein